jgi:hypothetical protein
MRYPVCIAGKRACPPEDCGGVFGYEDLLKVLSDPEHEEYEDRIEWLGGSFDPEAFDTADVVFDDPEERFEYAFSESDDFMDDDFDEDDELDESEEDLEPFRASSRDYIHDLWKKVKADDLDDLSIEELRLARIIKEHEDEFFNQFEFADVTHDHQFDPETETNPFLHIFIHLTVENQLANKDPIEVFQFLNAMKKKRCSHHEVVHMIGAILAPLMLSIMHEQRPFDQDIYTSLLKKYKNRNPDKFFDLLEDEKGLYPDE